MSEFEKLTHSAFTEQLKTKFRIYHNSDQPVEVELIGVGEFIETKRQEMFSVLFSIPENGKPVQGLYKLEHDKLGTMELFLVPVSSDEDRAYEAVFNHLKKKKTQSVE